MIEPPPPTPNENFIVVEDGHFHFQDAPAQWVEVEFDQPVTLTGNVLSLTNLTTGAGYTDLIRTANGNTYKWTVTGTGDQNVVGALPRGNYDLVANDESVRNAANEKLDGNTYVPGTDPNGGSGDDYRSSFYYLPGDANRDRMVDGGDYGIIDNNLQIPNTHGFSNGDFNYSGGVTPADYGVIDRWVGTALPEPPTIPNTINAAAGRDEDGLERAYIDVVWTAPAGVDADGFGIYRSLNAGDTWTLYQTVESPTARSWRDYGEGGQGLADGTKYTYRVRAYVETGDPSAPRSYTITTNKYWTVTNLPGPGAAAVASEVTKNGVTLTWNDNTSNETGFEIEQTDPRGVVTIIRIDGANNATTKSHSITGLTTGARYSFRVRAVTTAQASAWSPGMYARTLPLEFAQLNVMERRTVPDVGGSSFTGFAFDGDRVLAGESIAQLGSPIQSQVVLYDALTQDVQRTFPSPAGVESFGEKVAFAGTQLVIEGTLTSNTSQKNLYVYDVQGQLLRTVPEPAQVAGSDIFLFAGAQAQRVDAATGNVLSTFTIPGANASTKVAGASVSGDRVILTTNQNRACLFDASGSPLRDFTSDQPGELSGTSNWAMISSSPQVSGRS